MEAAQSMVEAGKMRQSMAKRLLLNESKWNGMLQGILDVRNLHDPGEGALQILTLAK
jgi:gamma-glutamyl phosphate reductase